MEHINIKVAIFYSKKEWNSFQKDTLYYVSDLYLLKTKQGYRILKSRLPLLYK